MYPARKEATRLRFVVGRVDEGVCVFDCIRDSIVFCIRDSRLPILWLSCLILRDELHDIHDCTHGSSRDVFDTMHGVQQDVCLCAFYTDVCRWRGDALALFLDVLVGFRVCERGDCNGQWRFVVD
jgi:hypothetical protein